MSFDRSEAAIIRNALLAIVRVLERRYQLGRWDAAERQMGYTDGSTEVRKPELERR